MKKLVTTTSLLAAGIAGLHADYLGDYQPDLSRIESSKPWTVAASLRGFYDDNWQTVPSWVPVDKASFGFEARPSIALNLPLQQGLFAVSYLISSRWYEARAAQGEDCWDFSHEAKMRFDHAFSPRYRIKVTDGFLYGQEPDLTGVVSLPTRTGQSYIRNLGDVQFTGELAEKMGVAISYNNLFYNYLDNAAYLNATLNRVEQRIPVDLRVNLRPDLVGLIGYAFGMVNYTGDQYITETLKSDSRNNKNHSIYVGGDYDLNQRIRASLRGGAQYTMYDAFSDSNQWTPYVDFAVSYIYAKNSQLAVGFKDMPCATDVVAQNYGTDSSTPTLNQDAMAFYISLNHAITAKLKGGLLFQQQWGTFYGGSYNGQHENLTLTGIYFNYAFNQYWSAEMGYNYDWVNSDIKDSEGRDLRSYTRNRVYIGIRAQY